MNDKNKKSLIISTLALLFGIIVIALYCITPKGEQNKLEQFMINFDSTGGSEIAAITIEEGKSLNIPTAPTKEGYIFVGWTLNGEPYNFDKEIDGDMTLVAVWKEIEPDKVYYTVSFDSNGGTNIASQVVEENTPATTPTASPTREGYTFISWTLNGQDYDFNTPITSDVVLTAKWEQNEEPNVPEEPNEPDERTFTVRFNGNGGNLNSGCNAQTVKSGETAKNTCQASRSGYTLIGFNTNSRATTAQNITTRRITANTTYYAIWRQNQVEVPDPPKVVTYNVSFNANGGTLGSNCPSQGNGKIVNENSALSSACTVTRAHYQFVNWTAPNGRTTTTAIAAGTYTANWRMNTFTVGCEPLTYYQDGSPRTCRPYAKENNAINSNIKIYFGGSGARPSMNVKGGWDELTSAEIEIEIDGIRTAARKEN